MSVLTDTLPRIKQVVFGLAEDFWHDGDEHPFAFKRKAKGGDAANTPAAGRSAKASYSNKASDKMSAENNADPTEYWHAIPGEISEKMWGQGFTIPGGNTIWEAMTAPLGINGSMNILDLSAGLGGFVRKTSETYKAYITGLEPDNDVAERGMELSVRAGKSKEAPVAFYDATTITFDHHYDCLLARETFYRLADKPAFFKKLSDTSKPKAQIAFTDYILDPENREKNAVKAWMGYERNASPLGLVEMAEQWAKIGYNIRVSEDLTNYYVKEIAAGLRRFAVFLASSPPPDTDTKQAIRRRIETWSHRIAAMGEGLKFYRFYGTKH